MRYLLAIDVGNTQTSIGVFNKKKLLQHWRISTNNEETADEMALTLMNFFSLDGLHFSDFVGVAVSSVVPHCSTTIEEMTKKYFSSAGLILNPGIKTGVSILYDNPREIGADRVANAAAAQELYGLPAIVVDFGTATTFDVISAKGEYVGGVITPGIEISADALFEKAAKLARVELEAPKNIVGKNTKSSIQAGIVYGTVGMVDYLIKKIIEELKFKPKVISTGGLSELIFPLSGTIKHHNPHLTLEGLRIIFDRNLTVNS